jgi:hypothetical protein
LGGDSGNGTTNAVGLGFGGGIYNISTLALISSTVVSNSARGGSLDSSGNDFGGGIFSGSDTGLTNCTIAFNSADLGGGFYSTISAANTIFAGNTAANGPDGNGTINSQDYNLVQNTNGITFAGAIAHNIVGQNPLLGPLQDNGGPTLTLALLPGSPAIDQGKYFGIPSDQRGFVRTYNLPSIADAAGGNGTDIGAFEFLPNPTLNIFRANDTNVVLNWTTDAADFQLQSVTNLPAGSNWQEVTNFRTTIGNQIYVTNSAASTNKFYRLRFFPVVLPPG